MLIEIRKFTWHFLVSWRELFMQTGELLQKLLIFQQRLRVLESTDLDELYESSKEKILERYRRFNS